MSFFAFCSFHQSNGMNLKEVVRTVFSVFLEGCDHFGVCKVQKGGETYKVNLNGPCPIVIPEKKTEENDSTLINEQKEHKKNK